MVGKNSRLTRQLVCSPAEGYGDSLIADVELTAVGRQTALGGITMKRTRKCYNEEEFELDNIYNDDDDRSSRGGLSAMFY
ncbi:hypothetical protein [Prevotella sp.]|uniref:hypothetical protein n=1 Tax=Prevotella sp. TaxID=59823 RepID=UPI003F802E62